MAKACPEPAGLLVDTQLLLRWATAPGRLALSARSRRDNRAEHLIFSVVSQWEVAIKASRARPDFQVSAAALRQGLLREGFRELELQADHALAVQHLAWIHGDPHRGAEDCVFDRLLGVQAAHENLRLHSAERTRLAYGDHVEWVQGGRPRGSVFPRQISCRCDRLWPRAAPRDDRRTVPP